MLSQARTEIDEIKGLVLPGEEQDMSKQDMLQVRSSSILLPASRETW